MAQAIFIKGVCFYSASETENLEWIKKSYAEKIMIVEENQETPMHYHWAKMEDIINRGGGNLVVKLFNNQDRPRKLSPDDRFVGIIRLAQNVKMKYDKILEAMAFAFYFKAFGENGYQSDADLEFERLLSSGLDFTLEKVCGFIPEKDEALINKFKQYFRNISNKNNIMSHIVVCL